MKDTISLLMATAMLAVGGLGLFMYGNRNESQSDPEVYNEDYANEDYNKNSYEEEYIEDNNSKGGSSSSSIKSFFDNLLGLNEKDKENNKENEENLEDIEEEQYNEPKARAKKSKTKRQRKSVGTKRRY